MTDSALLLHVNSQMSYQTSNLEMPSLSSMTRFEGIKITKKYNFVNFEAS
jgi:hypothetical protein